MAGDLMKISWLRSKLDFSTSRFSNTHFYGESTEFQHSCSLATNGLKLASTYVEDAQMGQHSNFDPSEHTLLLYRQYHQPAARVILCGVLLCHLSLAVVEEPAMPGCHVPYWVSMMLESCFLMFYSWRLHLIWGYTPRKAFRTDPKNIILATTLVVSVCCSPTQFRKRLFAVLPAVTDLSLLLIENNIETPMM